MSSFFLLKWGVQMLCLFNQNQTPRSELGQSRTLRAHKHSAPEILEPRPEVGCRMHRLLYEKALALQPTMLPEGSLRRRQVWDSLVTGDMTGNGMGDCNGTTSTPPGDRARPAAPSFDAAGSSYYVDAASGSDEHSGSAAAPVRTIERALALARQSGAAGSTVLLRGGTHYLVAPLSLGPDDSGLIIQNAPGEDAWISGASPLEPEWEPHGQRGWKATLPRTMGHVWGLHELGDPVDLSVWQVVKTLARFPNAGCRDAREK